MFLNTDLGKLLLRFGLGALMLFHGVWKLNHGIMGVKQLVQNAGWYDILSYGVYAGEVLAPVLIILGLYARLGALLIFVNMSVAIYLTYGGDLFRIYKHGALASESALLFLICSLVLFFIGAGKYALNAK